MKMGVLKKFVKFTGEHLCSSLFFNKVAGFFTEQLRRSASEIVIL